MAKVSVIMGVYKERPEYLRLAIDSILIQTYEDFEFIIVLDDPHNTELLTILEGYERKDNRVVLILNEQNIGLALSLNKAIEYSRGIYLARMDADDISFPNRFAMQVEYLDNHPDIAVVGTNKIIIDETGKEISKGATIPTSNVEIKAIMRYSNIMVHPSIMMRSDIIKEMGGYRAFPATQDYDLWSRLLDKDYRISNIDEYLIKYRINTSGVSMGNAYKQFVVGKYIEKLDQERQNSGEDSYSVEGLNQFMKDNRVDDPEECRAFQNARAIFEEGRLSVKNGKMISGGAKLIKAACLHPYMKNIVINQIKCAFIKRKYRAKR